ncbi:hypothetical protein TBK1r_77600 [Stieleria magnilauensis]|uniref:Uncharacterized protein n=1 Tax=Stieleria magnilauensis TaxID=2527963 RepID=A0ABX5Y373_9BACT|nr:hypothetical protein TBK1r_77600 [Planctomycetes bacterium TBK1r]
MNRRMYGCAFIDEFPGAAQSESPSLDFYCVV